MIHTLESWDTHWTHTSKAWDTVGYNNYKFWDTLYLQDWMGPANIWVKNSPCATLHQSDITRQKVTRSWRTRFCICTETVSQDPAENMNGGTRAEHLRNADAPGATKHSTGVAVQLGNCQLLSVQPPTAVDSSPTASHQ